LKKTKSAAQEPLQERHYFAQQTRVRELITLLCGAHQRLELVVFGSEMTASSCAVGWLSLKKRLTDKPGDWR
jgi:hypothetical protein